MCSFFARGVCIKGNDCPHAHSDDQLRNKPALRKTRLCETFRSKGFCKHGDACSFAHGADELCATENFFKTKMCRVGMKCKLGTNCRFAHHTLELPSSTAATTLSSREDASSKAARAMADDSDDDTSRSSWHHPLSRSNSPQRCSVSNVADSSPTDHQARNCIYTQQPCIPTLQLPTPMYTVVQSVYPNYLYDCASSPYARQNTPLQMQSFVQPQQTQPFAHHQIMQILLNQQLPVHKPSTASDNDSPAASPQRVKPPFEFVGRPGTSPACLVNLDTALFAKDDSVTPQPRGNTPPDSCSEPVISTPNDDSPHRHLRDIGTTGNDSPHFLPGIGTPNDATDNDHGDNDVGDESRHSRMLEIATPKGHSDDDDVDDDDHHSQHRFILDIATPDPSPRQHPDFMSPMRKRTAQQYGRGNVHCDNEGATPSCSGKTTDVMKQENACVNQDAPSTPCIGSAYNIMQQQQQMPTTNVLLMQSYLTSFNMAIATPMTNGTVIPIPAVCVATPTWGMFHASPTPPSDSMARAGAVSRNNAGAVNAGSVNTGSVNAGSVNAGSVNAESVNAR
eukprot:GEMP01020207.1.p1 GENE.GEMP01020207.1~~GEMP01020207.1.p1  ORF type:complete len:564 (+),score=115.89 GEMP01020207.1:279-1970(+)